MFRPQRFIFLVGALAVVPAAFGAEAEIYVTTGLDGVEVFSNLPRGPAIRPEYSPMAAKGRAVIVSRESIQPLGAVADDHWSASDAEATGKAYLLDD